MLTLDGIRNTSDVATYVMTEAVRHFRIMAGPDYSWDDVKGGTIDSAHRVGLTILMYDAQDGLCVACGDELEGERYDLCHVVSAPSGRGLFPQNVYLGHTSCNSDDTKEFGYVVPLASLIRLDLMPLAWPSRKECVKAAAELRETRKIRRQNRIATVSL